MSLTKNEIERLDQDGYVALEGVVDRKAVTAMRTRLEDLLASTPQDHAGTMIVSGLLNEAVFDAAWLHPRVLAGVRHLLGPNPRLMGFFSRGLRPGHGQQELHVDWGGNVAPGLWYACHAICALVDFTAQNGATRVLPGSHRNPWMLRNLQNPRKPHPEEGRLTGPAGTVFILNIHCGHSAVHNASAEPRLALMANFSRRDSPLLAMSPSADPEPLALARHSPEIQELLKA